MATSCSADVGVAAFRCSGPSSLPFGGPRFHRREEKKREKEKKEIGWPPPLFSFLVGFCCLFFLTHNVPQDTPTKRQQCRSHKNKKHKIANGWVVLRLLKGSFPLLPLIGCLIPEPGANLCCRIGDALWLAGSAE
jgi:hypothetical protein